MRPSNPVFSGEKFRSGIGSALRIKVRSLPCTNPAHLEIHSSLFDIYIAVVKTLKTVSIEGFYITNRFYHKEMKFIQKAKINEKISGLYAVVIIGRLGKK